MSSNPADPADVPEQSGPGETLEAIDRRGGLLTRSFVALLATQFLVALNDNMFRWLLIPIGKEMVGQDIALWAGSMCFLLPFVLLAAPAGYFADRFSKRSVMISCKVAEIVIMTTGIAVILSGNIYLMLIVLFLMGAQSAMFSPSKYSSIPEIVRTDRISSANGLIGMTTMVAIILGSVAGGYLYTWTTPPSILVVDDEAPERKRVCELVISQGFRAKEADSLDAALDLIRRGTPKLVLLDDRLPQMPGNKAVTEIRQNAGNVPVLLLTDDPGAGSEHSRTEGISKSKTIGRLAKPVDPRELEVAIRKIAGSGVQVASVESILPGQMRWWISAAALIGVAVAGWIASLFIGRLGAANPASRFPLNAARQTVRDLATLISKRPLFLAALGAAYFWSLGVLVQLNIDKFARPELVLDQQHVGYLLAVLMLGIGGGAALAGIWSAGKIQLGIVPIGAAGMACAAMLLYFVPQGVGSPLSPPYYWACFLLLVLGVNAGLYDIPLLAFLQDRSPKEVRGRILAANNFMAFSGMLLASGIFVLMGKVLGLSARQIWLIAGMITVPVCLVIAWLVLVPLTRVLLGLLVGVFYRVRVEGLQNVPEEGGALLVGNHVTWLDGVFLVLYCPRPIRFIAYADYINSGILGRIARDMRTIPIKPGRKSMVQSIREAREALRQGDLVCIFPEGGLSRTGQIHGFRPGFLSVLKDTGAPVIPVYLGQLWGSIFSFERGKFFWKWPKRLPYPVSMVFGEPIQNPADPQQVRLVVQELGGETMNQGEKAKTIPPRCMLRNCRGNMRRPRVADSTGTELSGAGVLMRTLILRRLLRREVLDADEKHVGLLLPPSVGGVLANAAVSLDGRVAVNLNYTVSAEIMNQCIATAGIRHVLTSRKVMERFPLEINAELVYLEDFKEKVTFADKLVAWLETWLVPVVVLERLLGLTRLDPDDLMAVIFTSGSTGRPKGVMLTYYNVGSNVQGFDQILHLRKDDVLLGILPFFHSFGYTTTLWSVLTLDPKGIYHYSPLEAKQIGKLSRKHGTTILIGTPTFLRSYARRCSPEDFAALDAVATGAEKLPPDVADAFEKKFGIRPVEGYGTTELSPVVSVNVPPSRVVGQLQQGYKEGTVGQPMSGVLAKVVDLETGEDLGTEKPGMLLIKGPNVMRGYLNQPELTAEVIRDGWYVTGDIAVIDSEGYIRITGRQSRFSKIGGEMIPHIHIEESLEQVLSRGDEEEDELKVAVTAVPDEKKGERLIVLHTGLDRSSEEICRELAGRGLPPIWIPSPDSFCLVEKIPVLGTGKLDLKQVKELALKKFSPQE